MKRLVLFLLAMLLPAAMQAQYSAVNQQLALSGSGYISVPNSTALNYFGRMTLDAWVYPTQYSGNMAIIGNDNATGYWFGLSANGKLRFRLNPSSTYESNGIVSLNAWTHVAVTYDAEGSALRFFVNGNLDRLISVPNGYLGWSYNDLRIGADRSGSSAAEFWVGRLDEVRVWKTIINFATASGDLYRIPHVVQGGLYGQHLVAAWRLNGNAGDATGTHDGSLVGSGNWITDPDPPHYPRIGVWFQNGTAGANNADYLTIPYYNGLSLNANYTIECWVKPSASGGNSTYQTFVSKTAGATAPIMVVWLGLNKSNNRLRFVPNGNGQDYLESSVTVPSAQWTHVAARFSGAGSSYTATLFVNGQAVGQKSYSSPGTQAQVPIVLGAAISGPDAQSVTYGYNGILDELRLWSLARSDLEIADNYRREFSGPETGLAGVYRLDGDMRDASGGGRHGDNSYFTYALWYFYRTTDLPSEPSLKLLAPVGGENWVIGDDATIRWTGDGLYRAVVELSRDGGSTWTETIVANGAASGTQTWTVTGPETSTARVRVRTVTPTPIGDESADLTIREPAPLLSVDPTAVGMTISQGMPLPPMQPVFIKNVGGGALHWTASHGGAAWLALDAVEGFENDDTLGIGLTTTNIPPGIYTETVTIGGNAVNHGLLISVRLVVSSQKIYAVSGYVRDSLGNGIADIPMHADGELDRVARSGEDGHYDLADLPSGDYVVAPETFYYHSFPVERTFTPLNNIEPSVHFTLRPSWGTMLFRYHEGWNLVSIPLVPDQPDVTTYLPDAQMPAFAWDPDSGYVRRWQLEPFTAYWIKFAKTDSVELRGRFQRDLTLAFGSGETGWSMAGMPSGPCAVDDILQNPAGMLLSVYEYDPVYGYILPADRVMMPGRGFFVKIGVEGSLLLRGAEAQHSSPAREVLRYPAALRR